MTMNVRTDRRRLLISGAAAGAFFATRPWRTFIAFEDASMLDRLSGLLPAADSTLRVGVSYLRSYPDHATREVLAELISSSLGAHATVSDRELARLALATITDELRSRETVRLDGWIVAPTEARLAALTALA